MCLSNQDRAQCHSCIPSVKSFSGCSEEGDHEVCSICYILRKNKKYQPKQMLQKTLFSLRSSNTRHNIPFNFQFFYQLKAKVHHFLKSLHGISIFYSIWVLLKFIFTLREYQKIMNLLKKEKVFFNWDSLHARLNSH